MAVSDGAIEYDEILRILAGKLSIPVAFEAFELLNSLHKLLNMRSNPRNRIIS